MSTSAPAMDGEALVLSSANGQHRMRLFLRDDGRLTVKKLKRNQAGKWIDPGPGQGEQVVAWVQGANW